MRGVRSLLTAEGQKRGYEPEYWMTPRMIRSATMTVAPMTRTRRPLRPGCPLTRSIAPGVQSVAIEPKSTPADPIEFVTWSPRGARPDRVAIIGRHEGACRFAN